MKRSEAAEYVSLRDRFDADKPLTAEELARFLALDRAAADELDRRLQGHPMINWTHESSVGHGWWACKCGAGGGGYRSGHDAPPGSTAYEAHAAHVRQIQGGLL